ncbi:MAG: T9SS type A sorting domain-containing protein [Chitinophagales bacterium]|nr:T9SS type A sorting domain-containing protein [Chitinophagales bacterium]
MKSIFLKKMLSAVLIIMGTYAVQSQTIYVYTDDLSGNPSSVDPNVAGTDVKRANGVQNKDFTCPSGFTNSNFSTSTTWNSTLSAIEFRITPAGHYQVNVTGVSADIRRSSKGPQKIRFAYSTDNGATWIDEGADHSPIIGGCGVTNAASWDIPDFSTDVQVLVRLYGYNANTSAGRFQALNIVLSGTVTGVDEDGDGYDYFSDCQDNVFAVNPGATEICNSYDDDCDGLEDADDPSAEGLLTFYVDHDDDGYGDPTLFATGCTMPVTTVDNGDDCNDDDASINPAAEEVCDGIDNDCDGDTDEGLTFDIWYADTDIDGYGDAASSTTTCDGAPAGYVADNTDCNDGDASINPGAAEVCNSIDDNCNIDIDEDIDLSIAITPSGEITVCYGTVVTLTGTAGFDSYQWYKNGSPISGATLASVDIINPGYYQVDGMQDDCSSGLSAEQAIAVTSYPNDLILTPEGLDLCDVADVKIKAATDPTYTWQWYKDGSELTGETDNVYFATATGDYYCVVTSAGSCSVTTATVTVISSCRIAGETNEFEIYPNPAYDNFMINMNIGQDVSEATLAIYTVTGVMVAEYNLAVNAGIINTSISLQSNIENGVYVVKVNTDAAEHTSQLTIIR